MSKLPTKLIEAFKGTLEEVKYADLLLHVVDASNKDLDIQIQTTFNILKELEVLDKPIITVFNKMDKVNIHSLIYDNRFIGEKVFISAKTGENLDKLLFNIQELLPYSYKFVTLNIPFDKHKVVDYFMQNYEINNMKYTEEGTILELNINPLDLKKI